MLVIPVLTQADADRRLKEESWDLTVALLR
jgi:hypothetical protein